MIIGERRENLRETQQVADLERARDEAVKANRAKSRFLANLSHEIRNPMSGVVGMAELLLETRLDDTQRAYATAIQTSAEALMRVVDDLRDLSRIEAGKLALDLEDFALGTLIEGVVDLLAPPAHRKGLEIACRIPPDFPEHLRGDPARLRQVLSNLVGNAVKFTQAGQVVVETQLLDESEASVTFRLTVRDTGVGIPEDQHDAIFESYHQVGSNRENRDDGSGLGLAICKTLTRLMGGRIGLESRGGRGATFWLELTLPRATDESSLPPDALRGCRVLLGDAGAATRSIICEYLEAWGCQVEEVATGACDCGRFDLAILDQGLCNDPRFKTIPVVWLCPLGLSSESPAPGVRKLTRPVRRASLRAVVLDVLGVAPAAVPIQPLVNIPLHVLVAEDHEVNRLVAVKLLERHGCRAETVANGREALALLTAPGAPGYDLVLMDVQMPEMDGFAATAAIRRAEAEAGTGRHLPIIAMTAHAMEGDRDRCLSAGMDGYLLKPVRPEDLLVLIRQWGSQQQGCPPLSFSREELSLSCGGDPILQGEILRLFLKEATRGVTSIKAAIEADQSRELARLAHGLRGSCLIIGAAAIGQWSQGLESAAKNGDLATARTFAADLDRLWNQLRDDLIRTLATLPPSS